MVEEGGVFDRTAIVALGAEAEHDSRSKAEKGSKDDSRGTANSYLCEFVKCLLKSAPIHEWANMHGGCRVEVQKRSRGRSSSSKEHEPGDKRRNLGSDAMTSPYRTTTVS